MPCQDPCGTISQQTKRRNFVLPTAHIELCQPSSSCLRCRDKDGENASITSPLIFNEMTNHISALRSNNPMPLQPTGGEASTSRPVVRMPSSWSSSSGTENFTVGS